MEALIGWLALEEILECLVLRMHRVISQDLGQLFSFVVVGCLMVHLSHLVDNPQEIDIRRLLKEFFEISVICQQLLVLLLGHPGGFEGIR